MIPGTGEYALATTPVHYADGPGVNALGQCQQPQRQDRFRDLAGDAGRGTAGVPLGLAGGVVVRRRPALRVLQGAAEGRAGGARRRSGCPGGRAGSTRAEAEVVPQDGGRPVYGGTPADASVVEAIAALKAAGQEVMFYPFMLMEQLAGNGLPDPHGAAEQPALPWRGRITLALAPGQAGSTDGTAAAEAEVAAFFGTARAGGFLDRVGRGGLFRSGRVELSALHPALRASCGAGRRGRCVLHRLRDARADRRSAAQAASFPAVDALRRAGRRGAGAPGAGGGRSAMPRTGPNTAAISIPDGGICCSRSIRCGPTTPSTSSASTTTCRCRTGATAMTTPTPAAGRSTISTTCGQCGRRRGLRLVLQGARGRDAADCAARSATAPMASPGSIGSRTSAAGGRTSTTSGSRGVRQTTGTLWVPQSKPVWFTEIGCAAIDKGTNQPNKFLDPKSSESALPQVFDWARATTRSSASICARSFAYWQDEANNPVSEIYGGRDDRHGACACLGLGRAAVSRLPQQYCACGATATTMAMATGSPAG